jgi:hypothetical protein
MSLDLKTARDIADVVLVVAAICTTAFPVLYLPSPWYKSHLGRAVMIQSASLAFAIDISLLLRVWKFTDDLATLLTINIVLLALISIGSIYLTVALLYYNFFEKGNFHDTDEVTVPE